MSTADELAKLAALLQSGNLSQEEFDQEKARLLGNPVATPPAPPPMPSLPQPPPISSVPASSPSSPSPKHRRGKRRVWLFALAVAIAAIAIASSLGGSSRPVAVDPLVAKVIKVVAKPNNKSTVVVYAWNTGKKPVSATCGIWQFLPTNQGGNTPDMTAMVGGDTWTFVSPVPPVTTGGTTEKVQGRVVSTAESVFTTITDPVTQSNDAQYLTVGATIVQCRPLSQGQYNPSNSPTSGPGT